MANDRKALQRAYRKRRSNDPAFRAQDRAKSRERRKRVADLIRSAKNEPCQDCRVLYPFYVMDLDHRPGTRKISTLSDMHYRGVTQDVAIAEIAKCDIVCANCHRERTYQRRQKALAKKRRGVILAVWGQSLVEVLARHSCSEQHARVI